MPAVRSRRLHWTLSTPVENQRTDPAKHEGYALRLNRRAEVTSRVRCGKQILELNYRVICNGKVGQNDDNQPIWII